MGVWICLSLLSAFAFYVATSLHRPILILATGFTTLLGLVMILLRIFLYSRIRREIRGR